MITIPNPCHENWNAMTPAEKGRHCAACDKVVKDFTHMGPEEIKETLKETTGKVCGRVHSAHLNKTPRKERNIFTGFIRKISYSGLALLTLSFLLKKSAEAQSRNLTRSHEPKGHTIAPHRNVSHQITVVVVDPYEKKPVKGATVNFYSGGKNIGDGKTNEKGELVIEFRSDKIVDSEISLDVYHQHYYKYVKGIYLRKEKHLVRVKLEEDMIEMGDICIDC